MFRSKENKKASGAGADGPENKVSYFASRRFRAGGYSAAVVAIVTAIVIAVNVFIGRLPTSITKFDTSPRRIFTLSDQTKDIVGALEKEVTIYLIAETGKEDNTLVEFIQRYAQLNDRLIIKNIDPVLMPSFTSQYTDAELNGNSVIVTSGSRSQAIDYYDVYVYDYTDYMNTGLVNVLFDGESALTSAISYVTSDNLPIMYELTGHGEQALSDSFELDVHRENIDIKQLSLKSEGAVPEDAGCLFINAPASDLSEFERDAVIRYLEGGGKMLLITDWAEKPLENLAAVMENYGLGLQEGIIIEGDPGYSLSLSAAYIMPRVNSHEITDPLINRGMFVSLPLAQGIIEKESFRSSVNITPLLTTSDKAFSKLSGWSSTSLEYESGDIYGQYNVAAAITESVTGGETMIVWYTTSMLLDPTINQYSSNANIEIFLNSVNWLCGREEGISIRSKQMSNNRMIISASESAVIGTLFAVVAPLLTLAVGFVMWLKRSKK